MSDDTWPSYLEEYKSDQLSKLTKFNFNKCSLINFDILNITYNIIKPNGELLKLGEL